MKEIEEVRLMEACKITGWSPKNMRYNIKAGNIKARKVGKLWIVSVRGDKPVYNDIKEANDGQA